MSSPQEESVPITDATALQVTKPTQTGLSFLSLPPEVRNMIYHYIFTPVTDGTCWTIYANPDDNRLKSVRYECIDCQKCLAHHTCHAEHLNEAGFYHACEIPHNHIQAGILQTCSKILEEAAPVSLAHMHLSIYSYSSDFLKLFLKVLVAGMRQYEGAYVSRVTYTCDTQLPHRAGFLAQNINQAGIRIGHLILHDDTWGVTASHVIKHFVGNLDSLKHKPASVKWLKGYTRFSDRFEASRTEFNEAAQKWLAQTITIKTADCNAPLPLLREFLPRYFGQSSN